MRLEIAYCLVALLLAGCSSSSETGPNASLPINVGNGVGQQYGTYPEQPAGEMVLPSGDRCTVFNWDRPLTKNLAVRVQSASCVGSKDPAWAAAREISRKIIPMSQSNLKEGQTNAP